MTIDVSEFARAGASTGGKAAQVRGPAYDRAQLRRSIVHIGVGGFHRAHLATYVHELCQAGDTNWSIVGAGVLPADAEMADALAAQDGLYTLITRDPVGTDVEVIGSIVDYIHAVPDPDELIESIAAATTHIVSLTVTEGGYPIDDLTGDYLPTATTAGPESAFGIIAAGLERRRSRGTGGLTVISCDNIIGNGRVARTATLGEARRLSEDLAAWADASVTFPNSMVDRITPATNDADRAWLAETHDLRDRWPVVTEPFRQWVIEDNFAGDRLPLEALDVLATDDVEPYELVKLRMLNAAHSCLAYLAALAGIETVDEALADAHIREFTAAFLDGEARPVLPEVHGIDLQEYAKSVIERFSNPNIRDQIARLCLDGSAKLPKFLLPTIRGQLDADGPVQLAALALAGWCEYLTQPAELLSPDPLLDRAMGHAQRSLEAPAAFLDFEEVFDEKLRRSEQFRAAFVGALSSLRSGGVRSAIDKALKGPIHAGDATGS